MKLFNTHGVFGWAELKTADLEGASEFYASVLGWEIMKHEFPEGMYHSGVVDGEPVAGMMWRPREEVSPHWGFYVTVDDVDEVASRVAPAGGEVLMEPFQAGAIGRMATISDPQGGIVSLMTYDEPDVDYQGTVESRFTTHGGPSWFELRVPDANAAAAFYTKVIGWKIEWDEMHMGPYAVIKADDIEVGGMFSVDPEEMPPHWACYVTVDDLDDTLRKTRAAGGRVLHDPVEVQKVGTFATISDPQGASIALMQYQPPAT